MKRLDSSAGQQTSSPATATEPAAGPETLEGLEPAPLSHRGHGRRRGSGRRWPGRAGAGARARRRRDTNLPRGGGEGGGGAAIFEAARPSARVARAYSRAVPASARSSMAPVYPPVRLLSLGARIIARRATGADTGPPEERDEEHLERHSRNERSRR